MATATKSGDVCPVSRQTYLEDLVCALIQGVSLLLCIGGIAVLVSLAGIHGDAWQVVSLSVYGATLIVVYLSSTLYHSARHVRRKRVFKLVDHSNIHLLIAGTYTPFALVTLSGAWGWSIFGLVWGLSVLGIAFKLVFGDRYTPVSITIYLAMGWVALIAVVPLIRSLPLSGLMWLVLGGVVYTSGVVFYLWEKMPFNHAVWQLFVLTGSTCFYFVIMFYVLF
jgi:hemolysin III